jgi:hypothetical protein
LPPKTLYRAQELKADGWSNLLGLFENLEDAMSRAGEKPNNEVRVKNILTGEVVWTNIAVS